MAVGRCSKIIMPHSLMFLISKTCFLYNTAYMLFNINIYTINIRIILRLYINIYNKYLFEAHQKIGIVIQFAASAPRSSGVQLSLSERTFRRTSVNHNTRSMMSITSQSFRITQGRPLTASRCRQGAKRIHLIERRKQEHIGFGKTRKRSCIRTSPFDKLLTDFCIHLGSTRVCSRSISAVQARAVQSDAP